jgi:hypothetical protein
MKQSHYYSIGSAYKWLMIFTLIIVASLSQKKIMAQNLESIGNENPVTISGGINVSSVFYRANGIVDRRDPFNYFFSGNLNISLYGWTVPLSFSYSNQESQFNQPFNQYGVSPTYKWVTMHAGYRSMTFSNYTLNGHQFLGSGFDIVPSSRIKISAFYGRLQKAVQEDTVNANDIPSYERLGGGAKILLGDQTNNVGIIIFKARDEINSVVAVPVTNNVRPEENFVIGFSIAASPHKRINIMGEWASSALTGNTQDDAASAGNIYDKMHFAFEPRTSSSYQTAVKGAATYSFVNAGIGLSYERVDPGYRTLGSYYFNNDLEIFAFTATSTLFKKFRMNGQVGAQRNNLDNQQLNKMNRFSIAVNLNYQVSQRFLVNGSYSNFQTVVNFRSPFDELNQQSEYENIDTLNFRQIAKNANVNINFILNEEKEHRQSINVNLSFQQTSDTQADMNQPAGATFYNLNSSYTTTAAKDISVSIAANANVTESHTVRNKMYGPSMSLRKTFFGKKLSVNTTASVNRTYVDRRKTSTINNIRMSAAYTLKKVHQLDLSLSRSNRSGVRNEIEQRFRELVIQLGYNYNFASSQI